MAMAAVRDVADQLAKGSLLIWQLPPTDEGCLAGGSEGARRLLAIREELESFGQVAKVTMLAGPPAVVVVSYADTEDAARARAAFGDRCSPCPTSEAPSNEGQGCKEAAAGDDAEADAEDCKAALSDTSTCWSDSSSRLRSSPKASPGPPRRVHDFRLGELCWDSLASQKEQRTALRLRGLSRRLCEPGVIDALMKEAGLWECVASLNVRMTKGQRMGCALLNVKSAADVPRVAKFFHGRQFGCSFGTPPVAVSFATIPGGGARVRRAEPLHIESFLRSAAVVAM
jgi:hypothetical protein